MREHLMGAAGGVTWLVLVFFVPMIIVSVAPLVWQLYARRSEALNPLVSVQQRVSETEALTASSICEHGTNNDSRGRQCVDHSH
jgi:hypothetical protein